jgi:TonB family protein
MSHHHTDRQLAGYHHDPRFGRLLFASLGVHLAVVLLFSGVLFPRFQRDLRPVYHVDLVNLPVMNPQAGRPGARPEPAKAPAKPAPPEPVKASPPAPPKPTPKAETVKMAKPEPVKPAAVKPKKPEAAQVKTSEKKTAAEEAALQERFRQMQARQEREEIKKRLDEMAAKDSRQAAAVPNAPVGSLTGKGTEAGTAWDEWLRAFFKSNWSLSKYQVSRPNLEAKVRINYDAQGNLIDYKFLTPSGDTTFDDSVKKAILFDKKLPKQPGERLDIVVVFNLKELLK